LALQVVYPALDAKVKNVTLAYSVEHEDEVRMKKLMSCAILAFNFLSVNLVVTMWQDIMLVLFFLVVN